jgi:hypothetical protein
MASIDYQTFQFKTKIINFGFFAIVGLTTGLAMPTSASSTLPNPVVKGNLAQTTDSNLTIKAVGDTIPGSNYPINELPSNPDSLFQRIQPYLQGADLLF